MPQRNREYKDLDLDFNAHPLTGDINTLTGADAVKRAVRNLILTDFWERHYRPNLGSGVKQSLFENIDFMTHHQLKTQIEGVLLKNEPRINLHEVEIIQDEDNHSISARIVFSLINMIEPITVDVFLKRVR